MKNTTIIGSRDCPTCGKKLTYVDKYAYRKALRKNSVCYKCRTQKLLVDPDYIEKLNKGVKKFWNKYKDNPTKKKWSDEVKEKIRKNAKRLYGKDNASFGKSVYQWWLEKHGKKIADKKQKELNEKRSISSRGKNNPMYGKPSPVGSGNGWSGWYKGWYFRSLHELSYVINHIEKNGQRWVSAEQKKYSIPYISFNGKERTYYADFVIDGSILIECKPKKLHNSKIVQLKKKWALKFCYKNGLTYKIECPTLLTKNELKNLHDTKKIRFLPRYEEKYKQYDILDNRAARNR